MQVDGQKVISSTSLSSQQCSRYYERIEFLRTSGNCKLQRLCEVKLKEEMERGENFQLFRACEEANISPNQLKVLAQEIVALVCKDGSEESLIDLNSLKS